MRFNYSLLFALFSVLLFLLIATTAASTSTSVTSNPPDEHGEDEESYEAAFASWMERFDKRYDSHSIFKRYRIFKANLQRIRAHNNDRSSNYTYTLGLNQFADLTTEEFVRLLNTRPSHTQQRRARFRVFPRRYGREDEHEHKHEEEADVDVDNNVDNDDKVGHDDDDRSRNPNPTSVDWRKKGAVTAVKNQGNCGSCWAFSSTGAIEGAWQISKKELTPLSEQELLDCVYQSGTGCNGGWMADAFNWVITYRGITSSGLYPYKAVAGTCRNPPPAAVASLSSQKTVSKTDVAIGNAVQQQPVSVGVDATWWQFYSGGVFNGPCTTTLNHGVLLVGFDVTTANVPYWIVKNSWGPSWGLQGYIYLQRTTGAGTCGVNTAAVYPIV